MTVRLWDDPPASNVVRLADHGRPFRPRVVQSDNWFEEHMREALARVFGAADARPSDTEPPGVA